MAPSLRVTLSAIAVLVVVTFSVGAVPTKSRFDWAKTKYVYAFGDSYTFVQGTKGHANFSFIGDAFDFAFTPQELLENKIIPKNTSSDGSSWTEFLTGCYAGKPSDCFPHQLWNFAFAGADIDKSLLPLHHNFTVDLVDEVKQWVAYASNVIPHPAAETLVAWWIGINDTGDTLHNTTLNFKAFWETEMQSLFGAVQNAYTHNLRGTYLFINVPPLERSPGHIGAPDAGLYKQNIIDYNSALAAHVASFAHAHPDVTVLAFDAHAWFGQILDNAAHYGFKNITGFCECTDSSFFWYNTGHPTEHVHRLLAQAIDAELVQASR
ncbi:carbohydrate esterase family 16 protein [Polyporus arcularius HHB13444]|uniref:Carbohydrate esterase family 16 protein n=1 Tax=Polyporus arcularius HHB13444 TaxID=1314778 RepID=A0A5C3NTW7_9APHY|nr:carbohydrate esterase family 16 protein [Polyporus arcularius HHB13444]